MNTGLRDKDYHKSLTVVGCLSAFFIYLFIFNSSTTSQLDGTYSSRGRQYQSGRSRVPAKGQF